MNQTPQPTGTDHYSTLFTDLRHTWGVEAGDARYIDGMLDQWHAYLKHPDTFSDATRQALFDRIAVGVANTLSIRDMLLVDALKPRMKTVERFAIAPHDPKNVKKMYRTLSAIFNGPDTGYDLDHLTRVSETCRQMAESQQREYQSQPYAMAAYLEWFAGHDDEANRLASTALGIDKELTLASIVIAANLQNIHPTDSTAKPNRAMPRRRPPYGATASLPTGTRPVTRNHHRNHGGKSEIVRRSIHPTARK